MNKRYELDRDLVKASVARAIAEHERHRIMCKVETLKTIESYNQNPTHFSSPKTKADLEWIDPYYDKCIHTERTYYAKVRVIRIAPRKYILVYGRRNDKTVKHGTGPSNTLREAKAWFLNGGR